MKTCRHCGVSKPLTDYGRHPRMLDGHQSWCLGCTAVRSAQSAKSEQGRARLSEYWRKVRAARRVFWTKTCRTCSTVYTSSRSQSVYCTAECRTRWRMQRYTLNQSQREYIKRRDGWVCYLCQRSVDPARRWPDELSGTVDHVMPVSAGGTSRYANMRLAHWGCNLEKGSDMPSWWVAA